MSIPQVKTVIIIAGPTAVGKTSVALQIANYFQSEIISADSRQCFKELNIGVARPSQDELSEIKHHFIASHSINEKIDAAYFEKFALQKVKDLFLHYDTVVMVGGTGLYIKAFCDGMDDIPETDPAIREKIISRYKKNGTDWLQEEIKNKDPEFYKKGEIKNPQRAMRALEVIESTGTSILEFRKGKKKTRDFIIKKIGLELPKEALHRNINTRVDKMIEAGLVKEVESFLPYKNLNALNTVGYSEIFDLLDKKISLELASEEIKKNTRRYAKRQMTWFKKDPEIKWFVPSQVNEIISALK